MGKTCCCVEPEHWWQYFEVADWIAIGGITINSLIAWWIIKTIQNRLTNKRVLKDHFISELKVLREEYRTCLQDLYNDKTLPQQIIPGFKLLSIKKNDIAFFIHSKYGIDKNQLIKYHNDLRDLVTNNIDFMNQYRNTTPVVFSAASKLQFIKFQQLYTKVFNDLIIKVNDAE